MIPTTYTLIMLAIAVAIGIAIREYRTSKQRDRAIQGVWEARYVIDHGSLTAPIVVERAMEECEKLGMIDESAMLEEYYQDNWRPHGRKISHLV